MIFKTAKREYSGTFDFSSFKSFIYSSFKKETTKITVQRYFTSPAPQEKLLHVPNPY